MSHSNIPKNDNSHGSARKRNLPSWMCSGEEENAVDDKSKQPRKHGKPEDQSVIRVETKAGKSSALASSLGSLDFSQLMEGVVFALSGFVNPERGILRSQMQEMGAEYQPDWSSNCTLLVCAFTNTPKFRQVVTVGGTVISKDWISQCYNQRKLVDIEAYLLNAGKPWRRQFISHEEIKPSTSQKSLKHENKSPHLKKSSDASSKMKSCFYPSKVKKWAAEDLKRTVTWLQNQDEKPDPSETNNIAAEGILTCLQDAIDALEQGLGIRTISEQWACIPLCIKELTQFIESEPLLSKDLCRQAMVCRQIYELEFLNMQSETCGSKIVGKEKKRVATDYNSDDTIEMTEEEINEAYNSLASTI